MIVNRAEFEAGIKLAAILHQFVGAPVAESNVEILEKAMKSCVMLQPFVVEADVKIDRLKMKENYSAFGYTTLSPEMVYARVCVEVEGRKIEAELKWDEEMRYPLIRLV